MMLRGLHLRRVLMKCKVRFSLIGMPIQIDWSLWNVNRLLMPAPELYIINGPLYINYDPADIEQE